ncbi:MAG: hypothetical protein JNK06_00580 [Candidatus Accumulibacter phosphatis]|nr:hypothetical protein [Candidatus Accumulibacter phosphatis]
MPRRQHRGRRAFVGLRRNDGRSYWGWLRSQDADLGRMIDEFNEKVGG